MRSRNLQVLTGEIRSRHPGVVIYGIGDAAHKLRPSDHNEDDTPGSLAAQSDADNNPEHRAIDIMLGPSFSREQARALIEEILAVPRLRARLYYINFENDQWSRSNGWVQRDNSGDPHPDHIHISGWAADDENEAAWLTGDDDMSAERTSYNADRYLWRGLMRLDDQVDEIQVDDSDPSKTAVVENRFAKAIKGLAADVAELKARPPVQPAPVDAVTLKAVLLDPEVLAGIAKAVNDEDHRRSAP